jgi:hypothetical protein
MKILSNTLPATVASEQKKKDMATVTFLNLSGQLRNSEQCLVDMALSSSVVVKIIVFYDVRHLQLCCA